MTTDPPVLGLVAGDGVYPEYIVRGARRRTPELRIVAVGFKGETNPAVIPLCDAYQEFSVGQISKPFTFLKKHGVRNVIMAGGITTWNETGADVMRHCVQLEAARTAEAE